MEFSKRVNGVGGLLVARNVLKVWALFLVICALLGGIGWVLKPPGVGASRPDSRPW